MWPTSAWILSFEFEGFVKAGGLGAAVAGHARALSSAGVDVTVLVPSHGTSLEGARSAGEWRGVRIGLDGNKYSYFIGAEASDMGGVRIIVFRGLDEGTGRILGDREVYHEAPEKTALYTRGVLHWASEQARLPDVLHSNDWTSALAALGVKSIMRERGVVVPWVHTIHLISSPSFPWHYASEQWSGLKSVHHRIITHGGHYSTWVSDAWDSLGGNVDAFAALESDLLTSVSRGFLEQLTARMPFVPREKTCFIYNSTTWKREEVEAYVAKKYGVTKRHLLRKIAVEELAQRAERVSGSLDGCRLLVIAHGRLVWQKGFDILIRAVDHMDREAGVLIMGISSGDGGHEEYLSRLAAERPGRVMVTRGYIPGWLLKTVVYSANAAAMPSRYEPFGISSIEAQALGTPVAATDTPGLSETVKDIYFFDDGGGMLVGYEDSRYLGAALTSLAWLTESADTGDDLRSKIPLDWMRLRYTALKNIRRSAAEWVDTHFRERHACRMLLECYRKAREIALLRDRP